MDISLLQKQIADASDDNQALVPVDQWNPPFCGDMNLVIKRSGQWWHEGTPFTRAALVKLLASVIKKEGDKYFLVTPVEKIGITVEDVPFIVIDADINPSDALIHIITQTGERICISQQHPVELREFEGQWLPYCHIRRNLWARVHQNVMYRWVDIATPFVQSAHTDLMLNSGAYSFSIGRFQE